MIAAITSGPMTVKDLNSMPSPISAFAPANQRYGSAAQFSGRKHTLTGQDGLTIHRRQAIAGTMGSSGRRNEVVTGK